MVTRPSGPKLVDTGCPVEAADVAKAPVKRTGKPAPAARLRLASADVKHQPADVVL